MAEVFTDLTVIRIYWRGNTYTIRAEEVKSDDKQKNQKYKATDSHDAYAVSFGECDYSIDLKGVQPANKELFLILRERARLGRSDALFTFATYEYVNGVLTPMENYPKADVVDISRKNNEPFDVKIESLKRQYRNAKNKII